MVNDGIYLFLQNVQIASIIAMFVCSLLGIVALVFFIVMMFHGIKVAKIYIKANETETKVVNVVAEKELNSVDEACDDTCADCVQKDETESVDTKEE